MTFFIEHYAHNNRLKETPVLIKVIFAMSSLIIGLFSPSPVIPLFIFGIMVCLTIYRAGIPWNILAKAFLAPILFTLPAVFVLMFIQGGGTNLFSIGLFNIQLTAQTGGLAQGLLVFSRVLSGTSSLFFLVFTTPIIQLYSLLGKTPLPNTIIELSMMIYRFIFVIADEATRMEFAQRVRMGYSGFQSSIRSFGLLASNLFIRSFDRGDRLYTALESRGSRGTIKLLQEEQKIPGNLLGAVLIYDILLLLMVHYTWKLRII